MLDDRSVRFFIISCERALENMATSANANATLHQEAPCLIDQTGAIVDQTLSGAVQGLQIELFGTLNPVSYTHLTLPTICSV